MSGLRTIEEYLKSDLMDGFHWSDMDRVTIHELTVLNNMANAGGYDIELLLLLQFWILFSASYDAQFLAVSWENKDAFVKFITNWIEKNH